MNESLRQAVERVRECLSILKRGQRCTITENSAFAADLRTILAALAHPPSGIEGSETGWLIEEWDSKRDVLKARWYSLAEVAYGWITDSTKALRFARAEDAQAYIDEIGWTEAKPTEHRWD